MSNKSIIHYINKITKIQQSKEDSSIKRYALFPILDEKAYVFFKSHSIINWSADELDFSDDRHDYENASPQVARLIDNIFAIFLPSDGAVSENIIFRFMLECKNYEEKMMFISQLDRELTHAETYGLAAFTLVRNETRLNEIIQLAQDAPANRAQIKFMEKWMFADRPKFDRLTAFACVEGISFPTLFVPIFYFRSSGKFPTLIAANELIAADESLHRDYNVHLAKEEREEILKKFPEQKDEFEKIAKEIITELVEIQDLIADFILPEPIEDLSASDLKIYVRLIADNLLVALSYSVMYKATNPFTWYDDISMEQKGNFYDVNVGAYKKKSLKDVVNWKKRAGLVENTIDVYNNPEDVEF